jgi:transcription antitermination protein NusB
MTATPPHRDQSAARFYAVQALFEMEASDSTLAEVADSFALHRFGAVDEDGTEWASADPGLFGALLETALDRQARIDQMADAALATGWPIARIDPTLRALFRAAGAELLLAATPPKVVIAEYSDIAGAFFPGGKETGMATAVLDRMARGLHPKGDG